MTGAARLFDEETRDAAERMHEGAPMRRLALADTPEAAAMRAALEACWARAGDARDRLRKGLLHERWGQHVGALAQLLALGLVLREGWDAVCEPELGGRTPDLLVTRDGARALVEVRAVTGMGEAPWESGGEASDLTGLLLDDTRSGARLVDDGRHPDDDTPRRTGRAEKDRRARARRLAAERAAARLASEDELADVVARVLGRKADAYAALCERFDLPYLVALYQDTDDQLGPLARRVAYGGPGVDGLFTAERDRFAHVSGVLVFGRAPDETGALLLRGELTVDPAARRPFPGAFPDLARWEVGDDGVPRRTTRGAAAFALDVPGADGRGPA